MGVPNHAAFPASDLVAIEERNAPHHRDQFMILVRPIQPHLVDHLHHNAICTHCRCPSPCFALQSLYILSKILNPLPPDSGSCFNKESFERPHHGGAVVVSCSNRSLLEDTWIMYRALCCPMIITLGEPRHGASAGGRGRAAPMVICRLLDGRRRRVPGFPQYGHPW